MYKCVINRLTDLGLSEDGLLSVDFCNGQNTLSTFRLAIRWLKLRPHSWQVTTYVMRELPDIRVCVTGALV